MLAPHRLMDSQGNEEMPLLLKQSTWPMKLPLLVSSLKKLSRFTNCCRPQIVQDLLEEKGELRSQ